MNAWGWTATDCIPHFLPLHHTHGVVNKLCCPLWAGAHVDFVSPAAAHLWQRLVTSADYTVFMAVRLRGHLSVCVCVFVSCVCLCVHRCLSVPGGSPHRVSVQVPTVYVNMIEHFDKCESESERDRMRAAARRLRLMVSGSAALPMTVLQRWREITGHTLLERCSPEPASAQRRGGYEPPIVALCGAGTA